MARKFVITGGPCTGKTTTIDELEKEFKIVSESAREVLKYRDFEDRNDERVQYEIFEKKLEKEEEAEKHQGPVFFDRGLVDSIGYYRYHLFEIPKDLLEQCKKENTNYEIVFFLDFVPYVKDSEVRGEGKGEAEEVHDLIYNAYAELGYRIVKVPLMTIKERVDFIRKFVE